MVASAEESPPVKTRSISRVLWPAWITGLRGWNWSLICQAVTAIAVPVSVFALYVSVNQFKSQQKITADQVLNQQRQAIMDNYLNDISSLVLNYRLSSSKAQGAVKALAVARTDTAVRNLDGPRKGILIRYLWEAGLIRGRSPVVYLHKVNLNRAVFTGAYLYGANLGTDYLVRADFRSADVHGAILSWANLSRADLEKANLGCVATSQFAVTPQVLAQAHPDSIACTNLRRANLSGANLQNADLIGANLTHAILTGADLKGARYNAKQMLIPGIDGNTLAMPKTQWPQGFNPAAAGARCIDC